MDIALIEFIEYGQWVLLLGVVVWLVRQMLGVISQNTIAIQVLSVLVEKVLHSVDNHETRMAGSRQTLDKVDGVTGRIEETGKDTNTAVHRLSRHDE